MTHSTMKTILDLLKSIKLWTIVGVIVSILGLYYTISDSTDKDAVSLAIGQYVIKANKELVVCCLIGGGSAGTPLLMQMPFDIANNSNKTIENVSLNYFTNATELENIGITNRTVSPPIKLSPLYYFVNETDFAPFEIGEGVYVNSISPMTSVSGDSGGIYHPMIYPEFSEDYFTYELPKFTLVLRGDECKEESYSVRIITVFIKNTTNDRISNAMKKLTDEISEDIDNKRTKLIFTSYYNKENVLHEIEGIRFFEMIPDKDNSLIYTK